MKVYVNSAGDYLNMFETSSHAPRKVHAFNFGELNKATIFHDAFNLDIDVTWKSERPGVVAELSVVESRTIRIIGLLRVQATVSIKND